MAQAYFAGGCFWCITPSFYAVEGVLQVRAGYSGGSEENPSYQDVKHQKTGHRETIAVTYDPSVTDYARLLEIFLCGVDPFDEGGQFIDRGHSYTLAIYYTCEAEKRLAAEAVDSIRQLSGMEPKIAIEPFSAFYEAEEEHQDYFRKNPEAFERELIESGRKNA